MSDANERRMKIIKMLMMNEKCTMKQLSDACNVSTRTIKRDIDILGYQYPICTANHRNGGVYISDYGTIAPIKVSDSEIGVIQKVILQTEQTGACTLDQTELEVLKGFVAIHLRANQK